MPLVRFCAGGSVMIVPTATTLLSMSAVPGRSGKVLKGRMRDVPVSQSNHIS